MNSNRESRKRAKVFAESGRLMLFLTHPLGAYWAVFFVAVVGALVQWLILDESPREAMGAATIIASVISILARAKGIAPWPPIKVRTTRDPRRID